jgi:hypothetical protein
LSERLRPLDDPCNSAARCCLGRISCGRILGSNSRIALFAGSDGGARHWALAMTLIQTAKLNGVDPMAWLIDVLERIVSGRTKAHELHTLLLWNWAAAGATKPDELAA